MVEVPANANPNLQLVKETQKRDLIANARIAEIGTAIQTRSNIAFFHLTQLVYSFVFFFFPAPHPRFFFRRPDIHCDLKLLATKRTT